MTENAADKAEHRAELSALCYPTFPIEEMISQIFWIALLLQLSGWIMEKELREINNFQQIDDQLLVLLELSP